MSEPGKNTVGMVEVLTRKLLGLNAKLELVLADGAEHKRVIVEKRLIDSNR